MPVLCRSTFYDGRRTKVTISLFELTFTGKFKVDVFQTDEGRRTAKFDTLDEAKAEFVEECKFRMEEAICRVSSSTA